MSNDHYLIVSYFAMGTVSFCIGVAVYRVLRTPFASLAEATVGRFGSRTLTHALGIFMTLAAVLGFLSVSYTQRGCMSYEQIVRNREYLVEMNQKQLQRTSDWVIAAIFLWCLVVLMCVVAWRRGTTQRGDQT